MVVLQAGDELEAIGGLHQVVIGPKAKRLGLGSGLFGARHDDEGGLASRGVGAEELHQRQPIDVGHDEVLQDNRGIQLVGDVERLKGVGAVVQADLGMVAQHLSHQFGDNGLIIDQQDHGVATAGYRQTHLSPCHSPLSRAGGHQNTTPGKSGAIPTLTPESATVQ